MASDCLLVVLLYIQMPCLTTIVFQPPLLDIIVKTYIFRFITVSRTEHQWLSASTLTICCDGDGSEAFWCNLLFVGSTENKTYMSSQYNWWEWFHYSPFLKNITHAMHFYIAWISSLDWIPQKQFAANRNVVLVIKTISRNRDITNIITANNWQVWACMRCSDNIGIAWEVKCMQLTCHIGHGHWVLPYYYHIVDSNIVPE